MTAAEKTRLLAERVRGWTVKQWPNGRMFAEVPDGDYVLLVGLGETSAFGRSWDPLTNLAHAGEVLEAMRAKGWHAVMLCPASGRHYCDFYQGPMTNRDSAPDGHESLAAAICHAALLAELVKEEEL